MLEQTLGISEEDQTKSLKDIARTTQSSFMGQSAQSFHTQARGTGYSILGGARDTKTDGMFLAISDDTTAGFENNAFKI